MGWRYTESDLEQAVLEWFDQLDYQVLAGPDIAPGASASERSSFADVVLVTRLRDAIARLNPTIPVEARAEAQRQVVRVVTPNLIAQNHHVHGLLTDGVVVEYRRPDGSVKTDRVALIDFSDPTANDWLVVNQFSIKQNGNNRRPDALVFVNGLPLAVIELKNPVDENATIRGAYNQLQTYQREIPSLFHTNELLVVSDGIEARLGALTSPWERFLPWRTIDGETIEKRGALELRTLLLGVFDKARLLDLIRSFVVFEVKGAQVVKKVAAYHQYHAVNKAVDSTLRATGPGGDRKVGVVWHTQGSGKSLSMLFYADKLILSPEMANPTLVFLTDRNDLDDQLFDSLLLGHELLRQTPVQASSREKLRELLQVASGGVIFTTVQKFFPEGDQAYPLLSERRNIVVIADEAHRSQYDFIDGFARHLRDALPNASFIGFTGTPIEAADRSTPDVFGNYIDVYDLQRAVEDGATVRIYYEGRQARVTLSEQERPRLDAEFEELTENEEGTDRERLRAKWARLEALVGARQRIDQVALDIVTHWEGRLEALDGKAMIVCMSRRICVDLYNAIIKLRPEWHSDDDAEGVLKVVMTGSASDAAEWQPHIRPKARREKLADRLKAPNDPLKLVIVRDMWLTGFDAPCLHTMYLDKPMRGHGLMQAIARVNRVFRDKPGGLVVDYLGLADQLRSALLDYAERDRDEVGVAQDLAVGVLLRKHRELRAMFAGFDYTPYFAGSPAQRLSVIPGAMEHILGQENGKTRYLQLVAELSRAFALSVPQEQALAIRDDVGFFQAVRAVFVKITPVDGRTREELDGAVRGLVDRAVQSSEVVDILAAAGMSRPNIGILSDEFLEEVRRLPQRNLAIEALQRLLRDQITIRLGRNLSEARSFRDSLERTITAYENRSLESLQIIQELIMLARQVQEAQARGDQLGLSEDELAFYDALGQNESAKAVLDDEALKGIARELVQTLKRNVALDWTERENVQATMRLAVKRVLRERGFPSDQQETMTQTVMEQARTLAEMWVA